ARDAGFGVQVIGRIMRRHAVLQAQTDVLPVLDHGYVFLANCESQEGLLLAGAQINTLTTQAPELGTQTVVTMIGDGASLQVVRSGEPLSLLVSRVGAQVLDAEAARDAVSSADTTSEVADALVGTPFAGMANATQAALEMFGGEGAWPARATSVAGAFVLAQESMYRYPRRSDAPDRLRGEQLPPVSADFEAGLAAHVDFSPEVLAD
ncbi:helicase SNF2, partial [Xanthomonas vasicola]